MAGPTDLHIVVVDQQDPRLGRQVVHDPRSRAFAFPSDVDPGSWRSVTLRAYDPVPNPNQRVGCCTGCQKATSFNTAGNRKVGRVLGMADALRIYSLATTLDPWPGQWNLDGTGDDTGSSSLAAAKAAQQLGLGGEYRWIFNGADGVVQALMGGAPVGVGTWWYEGMFTPRRDVALPNADGLVEPTGRRVGGHQWEVRAYHKPLDLVGGRCWWGPRFRDFWIRRTHLQELLDDDGDAQLQAAA